VGLAHRRTAVGVLLSNLSENRVSIATNMGRRARGRGS
jgi:hypothetical protein